MNPKIIKLKAERAKNDEKIASRPPLPQQGA